jgi:hypothetical protein
MSRRLIPSVLAAIFAGLLIGRLMPIRPGGGEASAHRHTAIQEGTSSVAKRAAALGKAKVPATVSLLPPSPNKADRIPGISHRTGPASATNVPIGNLSSTDGNKKSGPPRSGLYLDRFTTLEEKKLAVWQLGQDKSPSAFHILSEQTSKDLLEDIRLQTILALQDWMGMASTGLLMDMLRYDPSPQVRIAAAHALGRRDPEQGDVTDEMLGCLKKEGTTDVRSALIDAVAHRPQYVAFSAVMDIVQNDRNEQIRKKAAESLQFFWNADIPSSALGVLDARLTHEESKQVATALQESIRHLKKDLDVGDLKGDMFP